MKHNDNVKQTEITLEQLANSIGTGINDLEDVEIFNYCTGVCITLRCITGNN